MTDRPGYPDVVSDGDGSPRVQLTADHPGVADPVYRARRDEIAALAVAWSPGEAPPDVSYTQTEERTWRAVRGGLEPLWCDHAAKRFLAGADTLYLPADRIPRLADVTEALASSTGFRYLPVAGLAPLREFYGSFTDRVFWSTQYMRHHSSPLYTPEPDLCHEVLGHAPHLADPGFAEVYEAVGRAAGRVSTEEALRFLSRVFWHTIEFGVVEEDDSVKAYGAGLLSSVGELGAFHRATIRPLDWWAMGTATYDITRYQAELYCARSTESLIDELGGWLDSYDDETWHRLAPAGEASPSR
jgi:phenylalanine-4-hydroxylase